MPVYEYKCSKCTKTYTEVRSMTQEQLLDLCIECNSPLVRVFRMNGGPIFRGEGFYTNDKKKPTGE
jgi:putative FmdB family regulatory protein